MLAVTSQRNRCRKFANPRTARAFIGVRYRQTYTHFVGLLSPRISRLGIINSAAYWVSGTPYLTLTVHCCMLAFCSARICLFVTCAHKADPDVRTDMENALNGAWRLRSVEYYCRHHASSVANEHQRHRAKLMRICGCKEHGPIQKVE